MPCVCLLPSSLLCEFIVASQQSLTNFDWYSESLGVFNARRDSDQLTEQLLFVFVWQQFVVQVLLVISDPSCRDAAPRSNLTLRSLKLSKKIAAATSS